MSLVDHSRQQATSTAFDLSVGLFVVRPMHDHQPESLEVLSRHMVVDI